MAKFRCSNCGRKISADFHYCPACGCRVIPDNSTHKHSAFAGCTIAFCLLVVACACAATVWLIREHDSEEYLRAVEQHRADSLKTAAIAAERLRLHRADSLRLVNDSLAEAHRLEAQILTVGNIIASSPVGNIHLLPSDRIVSVLREKGYNTLRRTESQVIMGMNAEIVEGKVSAKGTVFSVASIARNKIEILFHSYEACNSFREHFSRTCAGASHTPKLTSRNQNCLIISE